MEIVHYYSPQSRGIRTHQLLSYYDIPHRDELIDLQLGQHKTEEYRQIHPYARVPALKHGDLVLVESGAITMYLADVFADKMNTPKLGTPERARFYEWMFFLQSTLEQVAVTSFDPSKKDEAIKQVRELLRAMATRFGGPHVLGEQESVLDVILFTEMAWYRMIGLFPEDLEPYASFMRAKEEKMGFRGPHTNG